ncbi:MAG: molybdenum cofactor biosynthesis protein MoaC [Planctomycetota bacterium]|jgi:cyclic pyranopterin phosphate synthase
MPEFAHLTPDGTVRMVDVGDKPVSRRTAVAEGRMLMQPSTLRLITAGSSRKGNVLETARLAGIMAAKRTPEWIPLCHSISLSGISIQFTPEEPSSLLVQATAVADGKTGVEMEALTAVSAACLTVYDMCKSADREMEITGIRLMQKTGGKSGDFLRESSAAPPET